MRRWRVSGFFAPVTASTCSRRWVKESESNASRTPASSMASARSFGTWTVRSAVASHVEVQVPDAVAFERSAAAMELVSVEFDDQSLPRPKCINLVSGHHGVERGQRQICLLTEANKPALELRAHLEWLAIVC